MNALVNWGIFLSLAGGVYWYYFLNKKDGQQRGRTLSRAGNAKAPVQWNDEEPKAKPAAKANKTKARKSVKTAVKEVGNKVEAALATASGAEGDDDSSPVTSPANGTKAPSGRDVSDMLEPEAPKTVLKISGSEKAARSAKPQQQRTESQTESKKQRQRQKKNEEAKAAREAAEEERKRLLEQQRRTARESRGEPARNGLVGAQAPASNAWKSSAPAVQAPAGGQLLDTIDNVEVATNGKAPKGTASYANLPSEEDQLRMAMEDSAWTTVPKGRKKAQKPTASEGSDSGAHQEPVPAPAPAPAVKPVKPVKPVAATPVPAKKENTKTASRFDILSERFPDVSDPRDSDWPVV
ncbi:hypothetical protein P280DRAFT_482419 [Massarina eburnea CBS 473.64]|uniref:Uncharacterized protein n=1 Tax=Massarina eburnea CBS 473.64 TaxID=1395130 RepID=A0A6A6RS99_9PLEO|nr:hypothetical protein P280DRAFT_482419 [Massarina eburnea CBS 473.64]